jgi:hypothetical protein
LIVPEPSGKQQNLMENLNTLNFTRNLRVLGSLFGRGENPQENGKI